MNAAYDVVILGGGIVGAACALECARAGMTVCIVERDVIGSGATAAGMGHIVAMDDSPAQLALTRFSQSLWNALAPELPAAVEYDPCGTIWVAADDDEMAEVERKARIYGSSGIATHVVDAASLANLEPNLRRPMTGGLLVPSDAVLYPPSAAAYLTEQAQQLQATVLAGRSAVHAGHGQVLLDDGTVLSSPRIVNACGALSPDLTPGIHVKKRKGHLLITDRYPGFVQHQLVELGYLKSAHRSTGDSVAFNVQPRKTGQILIGSSRQYGAEDSVVDHALLKAMLHRAIEYMPSLSTLSAIRVWTGFRAATPDKLPLIGPTEDSTVFLATGHEGLGITTSLATARLLLDHFLNRSSEISAQPYLPSRMAMETAHA